MNARTVLMRGTQRRVIALLVLSAVALCAWDLLLTFYSSILGRWLLLGFVCAATGLFIVLLSIVFSWRQAGSTAYPVVRRRGILLGVVLLSPLAVALVHGVTLMPLKFSYLIHRVESAKSAEEERRAFRLASRWGHLFEVEYVGREHLPSRYQGMQVARLLRVEWLESWPSGIPFQAYRKVIDEANLRELQEIKPAIKTPQPPPDERRR